MCELTMLNDVKTIAIWIGIFILYRTGWKITLLFP